MSHRFLVSVIEDDNSLRAAIVGLLESLGHGARGFPSAEAFLADDEAVLSTCIITDIQMSGLSGIDLKLALAASGVRAPVIMITARTEEDLLRRALASGAFCLLRKPFTPDALIYCVERALRASREPDLQSGPASLA